MPAKNSIKTYVEDTFYHIYNRGVEKRVIFLDDHDYNTFIFYLKLYLSPPGFDKKQRIRKTFHNDITLHSFCLMPNHFHLLIHQQKPTDITNFMRALSTSYSMYFNKKYKRVGSLFQGKYRAAVVDNDSYLIALSRYIHHNPTSLLTGSDPVTM